MPPPGRAGLPRRVPPKPRDSFDKDKPAGKRLIDVLPEDLKRQLREAQVPLSALDVSVPVAEPVSLAASLRAVAMSIEKFGHVILSESFEGITAR